MPPLVDGEEADQHIHGLSIRRQGADKPLVAQDSAIGRRQDVAPKVRPLGGHRFLAGRDQGPGASGRSDLVGPLAGQLVSEGLVEPGSGQAEAIAPSGLRGFDVEQEEVGQQVREVGRVDILAAGQTIPSALGAPIGVESSQ